MMDDKFLQNMIWVHPVTGKPVTTRMSQDEIAKAKDILRERFSATFQEMASLSREIIEPRPDELLAQVCAEIEEAIKLGKPTADIVQIVRDAYEPEWDYPDPEDNY